VVTQIFVASTHTPVLFFSSRGMAYRMKVWRLPAATPQSTGKALVNLLPLTEGESITSILPLPEDEKSWGQLELMFATRSGNVRRNSLADFESINRNGKIAMKLEEGDRIVRVAICNADDNVLLTTAQGRCIRFPVEDVRLFKGRDSTGVRGIRLDAGDEMISMAILRHVEASPGERAAYLKQALAMRRAQGAEVADGAVAEVEAEAEEAAEAVELSAQRYAELGGKEQFVLTVSERGFGKRSSSYEYRISGRGGKGITAMIVNERNGRLVASFPVEESDQIMLVTDGGQLIRCPVDDVRIAARNTQGVRIFKTEESEKVVSVERVPEESNGNGDVAADGGDGQGGGEDGADRQ
jgi:DNA gyrase subunit A